MTIGYSNKYPVKNRPVNNGLGILDIEIQYDGGTLKLDPNSAAMAGFEESLALGNPIAPSDLSGLPGYRYRTDSVELVLTRGELYRLLRRNLWPEEYFGLLHQYGAFHEIHDDFYSERTGVALQPCERHSNRPLAEGEEDPDFVLVPANAVVGTSDSGDWVEVKVGDKTLFSGHSIRPFDMASILKGLGLSVSTTTIEP